MTQLPADGSVHPVQPAVAVQPVAVQPVAVQPVAAFVHQPDCEVSMGVPEPVCTCPKQVVTQEPVVAAGQPAPCVGDVHQPGCSHL